MQNELARYLDVETRISVVIADCTSAAGELARAHLSGPTASCYLARALAGAALPIPSKGIEFAMVALFIVILTDQVVDFAARAKERKANGK